MRPEWTIEQCAIFAARKEFELLKLLAADKRAFAAARRMGVMARVRDFETKPPHHFVFVLH